MSYINYLDDIVKMFELQHLDIRTITLGISLLDIKESNFLDFVKSVKYRIYDIAKDFVEVVNQVSNLYEVPIANKRISLTPISLILPENISQKEILILAKELDSLSEELKIDYLAGFSALLDGGIRKVENTFLNSIPHILSETNHICSSLNIASSKYGIDISLIRRVAEIIKDNAELTKDRNSIANAKFVVFSNAVYNNPFIAGSFLGVNQPDKVIHVGISGPGVVFSYLKDLQFLDLSEVYKIIKNISYKMTKIGEFIGKKVSDTMGYEFGAVDLSLAPTPVFQDSIASILEVIGIEKAGAPGSTAALAMLTDAVKKGGIMATNHAGGLSGAFIPVSEDQGMIEAVKEGALSIEKLEAMTSVCSVGLDMLLIPGDTPISTIAGIIADEMAIGVVNNKTTAVRILPIIGKKAGDYVNLGGLLGGGYIMPVSKFSSDLFISRGGRIPPTLLSFRN